MLIHVVQAGETIYSIATQYGVNPARLMSDNGVGEDGALAVGQALAVLFPRVVHAVTEGDTLSSIARQYGVELAALLRANPGIKNANLIYPGEAVRIP